MHPAVLAELGALALAGVTVIATAFGARVGRLLAGVVFGGATSAGIALMVALPASEWVVGLALIPLTALSAVYFSRTVLGQLGGWRGWVAVAALLLLGSALLLSRTPQPLTRGVLIGAEPAPARSITPGSSTPVRG